MSFEIGPVRGLPAVNAAAPAAQTQDKTPKAEAAAAADSVKIDMIPSSPPHEVLEAMATADSAWQQLAATNRGLSFRIDDATGRVVVSVHDAEGKVMFTLPPSKALDIAGGAGLEQ